MQRDAISGEGGVVMTLDRERIRLTFRDGTPDERAAVVWACPPHHFRDAAATLSQSDDVLHRVLAMGILATAYCYGRACAVGAEIALAGHALGAEMVRGGRRDLQPETLSLLATGAVSALRKLGRNDEALGACDRFLRFHEQLDAADLNTQALRLARTELAMELCPAPALVTGPLRPQTAPPGSARRST